MQPPRPTPDTCSGATSSTTSRRSWRSPTPTSGEAIHAVKDNADAIFTWDYEKGARPALNKLYEKAKTSQWNGETDLDWSIEVDPMELVEMQRPSARPSSARASTSPARRSRSWGDKECDQIGDRGEQLDALAVHARRAGRADLHGQDRRDRPVDRRQVLRRHPGDGRGPPRRGLRQVPRHQARRATTRSTPTSACCSTTSSPTAAGT